MTWFAALAWAASLGILLISSVAVAEEQQQEQVDYVVSKWAFKRLTEATKYIDSKQYRKAIEVLESMKGRRKLNPYEKALMYQTLGYVYAGMEKVSRAIKNLEKCLSFGALPRGAQLDTQFNLGQLYLVAKRYNKAAQTLADWISRVDNPKPSAKFTLAMALVQAKRYRQALRWINEAIAGVGKPQESWLQLKLTIHFKLKQYRELARVLEKLAARFGKKTYWMQLAAAYSELKQDKKALAVMELAYLQGMLTTKGEIRNLISLYNYHGLPVKAAGLLEKSIGQGILEKNLKNLRELAETWLRARELDKAAGALEQAARLAPDGKDYFKLAQVLIEQQKWQKAASALASALKKGGLRNPGQAHLLRGIAFYYDRKWKKARAAFGKARGFESSRRSAEQWLKTLDEKLKRLAGS
ncbi:MAG: hypothetical protein D6806_16270 [Deltaproteobacteria bacterium]|nr:MAG: hypothetical protein D6806_16270 [Deltaproteobacteria bacterium]